LERDLISGNLRVKDLKNTWNEKIKLLFGKFPKDDSEGILQDSHWSYGLFGYFPSYAIGVIYASQLYKKLKEEIPDIEGDIFEGNFSRVNEWLYKKIHQHGARFFSEELIKNATGESLNPDIFLKYLNDKYLEIYA
jgi:carboxypeptidase Taq